MPIKHVGKETRTAMTKVAMKQLDTSLEFKQPRMRDIQETDKLYNNDVEKPEKGRFNIPIPILPGFVDTLLSKIDDKVTINYNPTERADELKAKRTSARWQMEAGPTQGKWDRKDRGIKKLAIGSGRGIAEIYSESDPEYKNHFRVVDHFDFQCEPRGGGITLEDHAFVGETNVFRYKWELLEGLKSGIYIKDEVRKLINSLSSNESKENQDKYQANITRFSSLGLSIEKNSYVGQPIFNFTKWQMNYKGKRHYMLFDPRTGICIRDQGLKQVFKKELWSYTSWATHEDAFNFWSKAPADDVKAVAEFIQLMLNQVAENRENKNWGMRAYNSKVFPNPSKLKFRPGGLVKAKLKPGEGKISDALYEFKVGDVSGTIDLVAFLEALVGRKTGVTPSAEGVSEKDKKVGIYWGDLRAVEDRLGLTNKAYSEFWADCGIRYQYGQQEHMPEELSVKMIGTKGTWDKIVRKDVKPDFDITITGGKAEDTINQMKKVAKKESLDAIRVDPELRASVSPRWRAKKTLELGFEDEEIRTALDIQNEGSQETIAEAEEENQELFMGNKVEPNLTADRGHIQRHIDYSMEIAAKAKQAKDKQKKKYDKIYIEIVKHLDSEIPHMIENEKRNFDNFLIRAGAGEPAKPPIEGEKPPVGPPGGRKSPEEVLPPKGPG